LTTRAVATPRLVAATVDPVRPRVRRKAKRGTFDRTAYQRDYVRKWRGGIVGKKYSTTG